MWKMISISEASKLTGVTVKTLKIWDNEGLLKAKYKTAGGHRRYDSDDIERYIGNDISKEKQRNVFVYCRVSTKKQQESGNLQRQKERLVKYCKEKQYNIVEVFEEVASGINDNRRQLTKMLRRLDEVKYIVVEYEDKLARFGYNYLKEYAKSLNVEIEVTEHNEKKDSNEEMVNDLISWRIFSLYLNATSFSNSPFLFPSRSRLNEYLIAVQNINIILFNVSSDSLVTVFSLSICHHLV